MSENMNTLGFFSGLSRGIGDQFPGALARKKALIERDRRAKAAALQHAEDRTERGRLNRENIDSRENMATAVNKLTAARDKRTSDHYTAADAVLKQRQTNEDAQTASKNAERWAHAKYMDKLPHDRPTSGSGSKSLTKLYTNPRALSVALWADKQNKAQLLKNRRGYTPEAAKRAAAESYAIGREIADALQANGGDFTKLNPTQQAYAIKYKLNTFENDTQETAKLIKQGTADKVKKMMQMTYEDDKTINDYRNKNTKWYRATSNDYVDPYESKKTFKNAIRGSRGRH